MPRTVLLIDGNSLTYRAFFALPVVRAAGQHDVMDWVNDHRASGHPVVVVATDEDGEADVADFDLTQPVLLLVGNETAGLSHAWREAADVTLRIPMTGTASSASTSRKNVLISIAWPSSPSLAIQSACTTVMPTAYVIAVVRCGVSPRATPSHSATIARRMSAYPATTATDWPSSNRSGTPAASSSDPAMMAKVSRR